VRALSPVSLNLSSKGAAVTHKRRLAIQDDKGEHIMAVYVEPDADGFEGADLSGLQALFVTNLRRTSFKGATLYWANLSGADFSGCNFEGANLVGASMQGGIFVGANFRNARLGLDNLGGSTKLQGADLTGADFVGADLKGAEYDAKTKFPLGLDPQSAGMVERHAT
jgi:Pentapeptide repeats (8 copies)